MRTTSHTQNKEPILEYLLSEVRFRKAMGYINKNSTVADLGCGYNGNLLRRIASEIKSGVGYDVSVIKTGLPKNIILKRVDINKNIDNRKNYFDTITALAALEHVENPESFLRQIKNMLKRGGRVIITTPDKKSRKILEFLSILRRLNNLQYKVKPRLFLQQLKKFSVL